MASKNVMQFLDLPRQDPKKAPVEIRLHDFREIYGQFKPDQAAAQDPSDARIRIRSGQGAYGVGVNDPVEVTVSNGKLTNVTMTAFATGTEIPGTLSADGTSWKPSGICG